MQWKHLSLTLIVSSLLCVLPSVVLSQGTGVLPGETLTTNPKARSNIITAIVPDILPPSTPILISPEDEATLTTGMPTFEWQESSDNVAVDHYQLWVDGMLLFDDIPTTPTENGAYTLLYDTLSGHYFLTPKTSLSDGDHTWQVHAYDAVENYATSVIWEFSIDTTAPYFEITDIGAEEVSINTGNAESVPEEPIHLEDNEPLLLGTGEPNAEVQLTITIPGDPPQNYTFNVDGSGNWEFQTGIFPRGIEVLLDFVISDSFGNISIISKVPLIINPIVIIIPPASPSPLPSPAASPTPTQTPSPTASPEATPGVTPSPAAIASPLPSPSPTTPPLITIPITPPREVIYEVVQETLEILPREIVDSIPIQTILRIGATLDTLSPTGALLVTAVPPLISLLSLLLQFGANLSWQFFLRLLQAIGLLPAQEPQGIVFNSQTNEPIPFALLTIESVNAKDGIFETVVTDENGIYQGIQLPRGEYFITVTHQDFIFPTATERPPYLSTTDFYKGETFKVTRDKTHQLFLIPIDPKTESQKEKTLKNRVRIITARLRMKNILVPMFIVSIIITLISPSILNYIVITCYLIVFAKKYWVTNRRANIRGRIQTHDSQPLENAVVKLSNPATTELVALVSSNKNGEYAAHCPPGTYIITVTKTGFVWDRKTGGMGFEELTITDQASTYDITLTSVEDIPTY